MPVPPLPPARRRAFTLVELLVAMAVLLILVAATAQMTSGVSSIVNHGEGHLDADEQARALLDRMALDFGAMVRRPDVDCYLKGRPAANSQGGAGDGVNDQIAFYTEVPGYFAPSVSAAARSSASLVAYRVNATTLRMERLCKGLTWGGSAEGMSMGFLPVPLASPLPSPLPSPMPTNPPEPLWPQAATQAADLDYEAVGPQVFRFEYYYVLKGRPAAGNAATLSVVPWYATAPLSYAAANGLRDVAGVGVLVAVLDAKSRLLVSRDQLAALAAQMHDVPATFTEPGKIEEQWMSAVNGSTLPRRVTAAVRIYTRCFYLNGVQP